MKKIILTALCFVFATAGSASAISTSSLGKASNFNLFTLNSTADNILYSSDIQGSVAIAGNASFSNYGVASTLSGSNANLVVGGELTLNNAQVGVSESLGSIYTDDDAPSLTGATYGSIKSVSESGVDFTSAATYLTAASSQWGSLTDTNEVSNNDNALTLAGTGSSLEVVTLSISTLESAYSLTVSNVSSDATVLVNVTGKGMTEDGTSLGFSLSGIDASQILYNFVDADSLVFSSFYGSILAPSAAVTANGAQINGQVIADTFDGQAQLHNVTFAGDNLPAVPLPCSLWLLGGGLLGLVGLRRRKAEKKGLQPN